MYASASGTPTQRTLYNAKGQMERQIDPDGVLTLYQYNARGELEYTAVNAGGTTNIDFAGLDRITRTVSDVCHNGVANVRRTRAYAWHVLNSNTNVLLSSSEASVDGLRSWQRIYPDGVNAVTTQSQTTYGSSGSRAVTLTHPDGSSTVNVYSYGRLVSTTRKNSGGNQVTQTSYAYDAHGRVTTTTDARNGATTFVYNNADQVATNTAPSLGTGEAPQATVAFFDTSGRTMGQRLPDGTTTTNFYSLAGLLQKTYGSRTYPVEYTYDAQGRMRTMKTWQDFAGNSLTATTRWNYDPYRGVLAYKEYPNATSGVPPDNQTTNGPSYTYTDGGRLKTRKWVRSGGLTTTYTTNTAGDVYTVTYSDGTPMVSYAYDRRGRQSTVTHGTGGSQITTSLTYNQAGQQLTESYAGGTLAGLNMQFQYDQYLRRTNVVAKNGGSALVTTGYGYDTAGRLGSVTNGTLRFVYAYHPNSLLLNTLSFQEGANTRLTTTRQYDKLNRVLSISSVPSASGTIGYAYQYNAANQRTRRTEADGSYWVYGYDALGQVVSGRRYWGDGTPVVGQQFEYAFDDIGNRESTGVRASAVSTYSVDRRNQYGNRTVAAYADVLGIANPTANVTVNGNVATRKGEYFHHALSVPNGSAAYPAVTVTSAYGSGQSTTGHVFVAASTETFSHDADGNLTADGRWAYTWDGENRLTQMLRDTASPTGARQRLNFQYDHQGRRIMKAFCIWTNSAWSVLSSNKFLYDGWNVVAELDATNNTLIRSYTWGTDLSGSVQGAGGVGGLLHVGYHVGTVTNAFVAYDGNGNVAGLVRASDGTTVARYDYGPFAEPLRATGPMAAANPMRFSTKFHDGESAFLYYGYRYYNPSTGRWLSRDPIVEAQGESDYRFAAQNPLVRLDVLGLFATSEHPEMTADSFAVLSILMIDYGFFCFDRILSVLIDANVSQDSSLWATSQHRRHYTRPYKPGETYELARQRRLAALNDYEQYLVEEESAFNTTLRTRGLFGRRKQPDCHGALEALGRLTQSWQDFFGHGIHEITGWHTLGLLADTPDIVIDLYPSSWALLGGGEHPGFGREPPFEPIEYAVRRYAAHLYVAQQLDVHLQRWLSVCRCYCEGLW